MIVELGVQDHIFDGTDKDKIKFLQSRIADDAASSRRFPVPSNFQLVSGEQSKPALLASRYYEMILTGTQTLLFEEIFTKYKAGKDPLVVITHIVDGQIRIDKEETINSKPENFFKGIIEVDNGDYLKKYLSHTGFDLGKLIEDDFLLAIKLLFKNGLYTSSAKLLVVCIDSLAFLEYGDQSKIFVRWLDTFVNLSVLKISSEELFEFRNSMLHMTNLDSRKVQDGKVKRIAFYIPSNGGENYLKESSDLKYFNYVELLKQVSLGINQWADSFNADRTKFQSFVERYDKVVSDSRYPQVKFY